MTSSLGTVGWFSPHFFFSFHPYEPPVLLITEKGSPGFEEFINILGDKIELKGWQGFRAGLDTNSENSSFLSFSFLSFLSFSTLLLSDGNTGVHSIYTEFQGYEVMFHVSTLLPYSTSNSQQVQRSFLSCFVFSPPHSTLSASFFQLERKRHVGNDIVVVIFQEGNTTPFSPAFMRTHFNRANLFLSPLSRLCSPFFLISPSFIDIFVIVRREVKDSQTRYRSVLCLVAFFFFFSFYLLICFSLGLPCAQRTACLPMALPSPTRLTLRTELCCENSLSQSVSGFGLPLQNIFFLTESFCSHQCRKRGLHRPCLWSEDGSNP